MMLLTCPYCGPRNETEFNCGGESHIVRPELDATDDAWASYLFFRDNRTDVAVERWRHAYGCGSWFNVAREAVSHRVIAVYAMTDPKPDLPKSAASIEFERSTEKVR